MQVLISTVSVAETTAVLDCGVDIIDFKNVAEGSLGAQFPWLAREIAAITRPVGIKTSATLGDLPHKPGTASLAAYGAVMCGMNYIKAGLYGSTTYAQAREMMEAVGRAARIPGEAVDVVAAGYADYRRFGGLSPTDLIRAAADSHCDVVMVDTAIKDGGTLFDALSMDELRAFVAQGHSAGLRVALAGSLRLEQAQQLFELDPDIIGVRGAVCEGTSRDTAISAEKTRRFVSHFHRQSVAV